MRLTDYSVPKILQVCLMIVILIFVQLLYGLLLATWVFIIFLIYLALTIDVNDFGSFFEREMSSDIINAFTKVVIDFLIDNLTYGQSIPYQSLIKGLKRQESFPEFLLVKVLRDLEKQRIIRVEMNEFVQKSISLATKTPYESLQIW